CVFFFQAEDGIRDDLVTGVQTCALPICPRASVALKTVGLSALLVRDPPQAASRPISSTRAATASGGLVFILALRGEGADRCHDQIGRASCRERGWMTGGAGVAQKS